LVAEPSAFGLNDLRLAVEMVKLLDIPAGVIINRSDIGDDRVEKYCNEENLPVWGRIPHDRKIAEAYSSGIMAVDIGPDIAGYFEQLADVVLREAER
jgi:MinD superfamily P-loop ATPase